MNTPTGKALFFWQYPSVASGSVADTLQAAKDMGLAMVNMKVGSGAYDYPFDGHDLRPLRDALGNAGIKVYGWHYVYGANNPQYEERVCARQIARYELDGYEIDAESYYKNYPSSQAQELVERFKSHTSQADIPLGLTTYRYPDYHPEFPWRGFLRDVDYFCPQVYWQPPPSSPTVELNRTIQQWTTKVNSLGYEMKPFFPAGRAYIGDGYPPPGPPSNELTQFLTHAKEIDLPGATFWSFDNLYTHSGGAARAEAIAAFDWGTDLTYEQKVDVLWEAHPNLHP